MPIDAKHDDLQSLRIDRSAHGGEPPSWARRYIIGGIAGVALLSVAALAYRLLAPDAPEVQVTRAAAESSDVGGIVLSATGYIVAHHKINVNTKVTGRVAWIGVEKGDKVQEGQVLVRLEDDEFRAQYQEAKGAADNARAYLEELQNGSRQEEIQQAQHNLDEARATLVNDKLTLDRRRALAGGGGVSQQNTAHAKGPRLQAEVQQAYAKSQLNATIIRAPVTGTILERTAEKGELITSGFASSAEGRSGEHTS